MPEYLRLFARLRRNGFDCECPGCGRVYLIRPLSRNQGNREARDREAKNFTPETQVFRCTKCRRAYVIGLNFYPIDTPRRARPARIPADTVPTLEQADTIARREYELRALPSSRFIEGRENRAARRREGGVRGAGLPVNTGPECTCPRNIRGEAHSKMRDPGCPRHGVTGGESPSISPKVDTPDP